MKNKTILAITRAFLESGMKFTLEKNVNTLFRENKAGGEYGFAIEVLTLGENIKVRFLGKSSFYNYEIKRVSDIKKTIKAIFGE